MRWMTKDEKLRFENTNQGGILSLYNMRISKKNKMRVIKLRIQTLQFNNIINILIEYCIILLL